MAIEFKLVENVVPIEYKQFRIASQAYQIGDALQWDRTADAVDVTPATSSTITAGIAAIAMEAKLSTDTTMLCAILAPDQRWAADATNATNTNHNNQRMVLTDKGTVNNTGTDSTSTAAVFKQTGVLTTTRIVGQFLVGYATT